MAKTKEAAEIQVVKVQRGRVEFCILGTSPIILNRMSEKARHVLLLPNPPGKTRSDLKHDPYAEFLASPYTDPDARGQTYLMCLAASFKKALCGAALDLPGATKAQLGRLTWVEGERLGLYGVPQLFMSVTRCADINRTPDIRTRVIVPKWACRVAINFAKPIINETLIANLLVAAGMTQGIGDWRAEKGSGNYGSFEVVGADNPEFNRIVKAGGRKAQQAAMQTPEFYDEESHEMFQWFKAEVAARGKTDLLKHEQKVAKAKKLKAEPVGAS